MSLAEILRAIEAEARREAEATIAAARAEGARLVEEADVSARTRLEAATAAAEPVLRAEAVRLVNTARLHLLHRRAELAAEASEAAWAEAERRLGRLAEENGERWNAALGRLAAEGLAIAGAGASVAMRRSDGPAIAAIVAAHGGTLEMLGDDAPPGPLVRSPDGRIEVDATLSARLARARTALAGELAVLLDATAWRGPEMAGP